MFYQCQKCNNTWQYPIIKCPNCFVVPERVKTEKAMVIGISKVNISTLQHLKVPYYALLLEDEKGNRWVHKSVKEYNIGEEFKTESNPDKNAVAIWRVKYDTLEGIEKMIDLLGGIEFSDKSKILILPALINPQHVYFRGNTSPQFLEVLISWLLRQGVKEESINIAGQSFDETPIEVSAQKSQLLEACQKFGITPKDLAKGNFIKKGGYEISEDVFNSDMVISLAMMKIGRASASENIVKFLKKENYLGLKYLSSDREIIEGLTNVLPKILTFGEAEVVQNPAQFTVFLGLILASFSYRNLDRVFFEISKAKELPSHIDGVKIEDIPITGRKIEEISF